MTEGAVGRGDSCECSHVKGSETNPCTGLPVDKDEVEEGTEPCQAGPYVERSPHGSGTAGDAEGEFDANDRVALKAALKAGKGYWLFSHVDGTIVPRDSRRQANAPCPPWRKVRPLGGGSLRETRTSQ